MSAKAAADGAAAVSPATAASQPPQSATGRAPQSPAPEPRTDEETDDAIAGARERIDDLDSRIIGLIRERMEVSAQVQRARLASGGRRLSLNREMEILTRYNGPLGKPGTTLAMTLLELCRGRV